jgi:acetyl-CoA C-acetyltransferase
MPGVSRKAAIVGAYEHPTRFAPGRSALQLQAECAREALSDAGLQNEDVDALYTSGVPGLGGIILAEYLNLKPRHIDTTSVGGASFEFHISHVLAAIAAGQCQVALITYGSTARSERIAIGTGPPRFPVTPADSMEAPYGLTLVGNYALVAQRHMHQYGTTSEQLAEIAVATRYHASFNPHAKYRKPITVEDVLDSRLIADPLHLLDCCLISDGAGAIVVASPRKARYCNKPPAWVLGAGEAVEHTSLGNRDLTFTAAKQSGEQAFAMADLRPRDIDVCLLYDSYTITVLCTLEDLGFCKKGQAGSFVEDGRLRFDGKLPLNTDGGALSSNDPGMRGIFLLIEATRQLRGEAGPTQVKRCRAALCHGTGGALGTRHSGSTVILGRD